MIRNVSLTNWKAFEHLQLELPEGTSFIVARNGVGKTSLLQALHFGLFGDRRLLASSSGVERAVRGNPDGTARVEIVVDLDAARWVITRNVPMKLGPRERLPTPNITMDGKNSSETAWTDALTRAAGVGLTELRLLSAIGEGGTQSAQDQTGAESYNLVQHLSQVLGVSRLRDAVTVLDKRARETSSSADNERLTLRDRPERAAVGEQEQLSLDREPLPVEARRIEALLSHIQRRQRIRNEWAEWRERERVAREAATYAIARVTAALTEHAEVLDALIGRRFEAVEHLADAPVTRLIDSATGAQEAARSMLDDLQFQRDLRLREVGGIEAQLSSLDASLRLLSGSTAVCPTCRQSLSEEAATRARNEHLLDRDRLLAAESSVQAAAGLADKAIAAITAAAEVPLPNVPPPPFEPMPDGSEGHDEAATQDLTTQLGEVRRRIQLIDAAISALQMEAKQRAENAALSRRLVAQYRRADLLAVTADAFERLADSICRDRISPLAELLSKRWSELWPGRPSLTLDIETGYLKGNIADAQISLADLSGGERAVAVVLLRLLALQSASNSPVLLMDEPLEHLDPRNRRLLASLLVAATQTSGTPPRQILVTTYEESVIRRLDKQVAGHGSNVVYISSRPNSWP